MTLSYEFPIFWARIYLMMGIFSGKYHQKPKQIKDENYIISEAKRDIRKFTPIYEKYYESIFLFVHKRVMDEEMTGDITSQVFFKCVKNLYRYEFNELPFSSWLYRIAHNEILYHFRTSKSEFRFVSLNDSHIDLLSEEITVLRNAEEKGRLVSFLLEKLDESEVQFLELRFFEDRSFAEIGFLMNITANNAKIKTYRVIGKLKNISKNLNLENF